MRFGLDGRALTGRFTGDRTYWRNLIRALVGIDPEDEFLVYSRVPLPEDALPQASNLTCKVVSAPNDRLWTLFALPKQLRADRADAIHVQYTAPLWSPCPVITSVHDISFRLYPEWFPTKHRILLNLTVPASMKRAARVVTCSESSRKDILRVYGLAPEKVCGVPLGVGDEFLSETLNEAEQQVRKETARRFANERFGIDGPFVLAVGVLQPRKNLPMLAEAFGRARAENNLPHLLVYAGKMGWGTEQETLRRAAIRGGGEAAGEAVRFTGYVEDSDLPALYRACTAFAYPSLYEGFGIPPLEAMSCGAPTLVSDAPAMPEVVGDCAIQIPPRDIAAWANGLAGVLLSPEVQHDLSCRGPGRAALFSWSETARKTLAVYREAVKIGR